jgi:hypothetical protein
MTTESLRAFAARKGHAVSYWHKQKTLGRLVMVDVGGTQMVDVERSEALIAATADPGKRHMASVNDEQRAMHRGTATPPPLPSGSDHRGTSDSKNATYMQAKTAREVYEAKTAQLEYEERVGLLVRAADVRNALAKNIASLREGFLQLPSRLVPLLVVESDPAKLDALLRQEIHAVLAQLTEVVE